MSDRNAHSFLITRHPAYNGPRACHYVTRSGNNNNHEGNQEDDTELRRHNPYCPHHAEWPIGVARGDISFRGGSVFSDMLMPLYALDVEAGYDSTDETPLHDSGFDALIGIPIEWIEDDWVHCYLRGDVIINSVELPSLGVMGEQVLDFAYMRLEESIVEMDAAEDTVILDEAVIEALAMRARSESWRLEGIRSYVEGVVNIATNVGTGFVALDVVEYYFVNGVIDGMPILTSIHQALGEDTVDALRYKALVYEALRAIASRLS